MAIAPDFTSVYTEPFDISFTQCMPSGYLKYTDLCNILQITAAGHAAKGGISFTDMQLTNQAWVLSRMRVEIDEMPKWRDTIIVKTWIISLENSRSVRALEVYRNGQKIIGCETFWAVFNTETRRPESLALPHEHFEIYSDRPATLQRVSKINLPVNVETVGQHSVVLSDLDIVNHANNVKYLEWCLDCENYQKVLDSKLQSFEMNFIKELLISDVVDIEHGLQDDSSIYAVRKNEKNAFLLQLNWMV